MATAHSIESTTARFWSKVRKTDGCWFWQASVTEKGYPVFHAPPIRRAHRFSWMLHFGPITQGAHVLHSCDTPRCVRPDHLFLGSNDDNVADKMRKGRHWSGKGDRHGMHLHPERAARGVKNGAYTHPERRPSGERHGCAKIASPQVEEIRQLYAARLLNQYELARKFGISQRQVWRIVHGKSWRA
jgi:predicted DNA-binding protein (UPF0251 family)